MRFTGNHECSLSDRMLAKPTAANPKMARQAASQLRARRTAFYNGASLLETQSVSVASILPRETIAGVLQLLAGEMQEVDKVIGRSLSSDVALIDQIAHIVHAGGKRMRPKLVLLFANALSATTPARFELAAVVEFIHRHVAARRCR